MFDPATFQAIASILSVIIAAVALFTAMRSEQRANKQFEENIRLQKEADERAQRQFEENLRLQKQVIEVNHKPVLDLGFNASWNERGVNLVNVGNGTAVITKMWFRVSGKEGTNLPELITFPPPKMVIYNSTFYFRPHKPNYLPASTTVTLFMVSREMYELARRKIAEIDYDFTQTLEVEGLDQTSIDIDDTYIENVLKHVNELFKTLEVVIEYEDILGNPQPPYTHTASSTPNAAD